MIQGEHPAARASRQPDLRNEHRHDLAAANAPGSLQSLSKTLECWPWAMLVSWSAMPFRTCMRVMIGKFEGPCLARKSLPSCALSGFQVVPLVRFFGPYMAIHWLERPSLSIPVPAWSVPAWQL